MTISLNSMIDDLSIRSARAILSQLGLRSHTLRDHLGELFAQKPGTPGALLAEPVLEAAFGWKTADRTMAELARDGVLHRKLVTALDRPAREYREHAFPKRRRPYQHQLDCWQRLLDSTPRSVLVSSGTGSGKTECFLVPILEDLVRQREEDGHLAGVQALFLYPLNALINSQRDRLRAWCGRFGQDIRFCLYNGETPEHARAADVRKAGAEQVSRQQLRTDPPPMLVTNATMLEYMLVRTEDAPIVERSQGALRWIVLDEAHTYIGSHAAEMTLLLRRVLHRFGVDPENVRFVATSATIGDEGAAQDLQRFLASLSGAPAQHVHVVTGERFVPPLPPAVDPPATLSALRTMSTDERFAAMCNHPDARSIRSRLAHRAETLDLLRDAVDAPERVAPLLELASTAVRNDETFLPLRVHIFHRSQRGLWACVNRECSGLTNTRLHAWGFGALYTERRRHCSHCQQAVFELVACADCGQHYLQANEVFCAEDKRSTLRQLAEDASVDEFRLDVEAEHEEPEAEDSPTPATDVSLRLLCPSEVDADSTETVRLGSEGEMSMNGDGAEGVLVRLSPFTGRAPTCLHCGGTQSSARGLRELRVGAPFALSTIVPSALEHTPAMDKGQDLPSHGRRILGFSDSRQGTARLAVRLQQDAERNRVRSVLYHALAAARPVVDQSDLAKKKEQIEALQRTNDIALRPLLEELKAEVASMGEEGRTGALHWREAAAGLEEDSGVRRMLKYHRYITGTGTSLKEYANFCLYREFFRRPKRMNSAETMGLVALRYPPINDASAPPGWPLTQSDWTSFLKLAVDFFVRDISAVALPGRDYLRWMGIPVRQRFVLGPGSWDVPTTRQRRWPSVAAQRVRRSRLPRLLMEAARLDDSAESLDRVNEALRHAWDCLAELLRPASDGYLLNVEKAELVEVGDQARICPYTGRVLDTTLCGLSPYMPERASPEECQSFVPPRLPKPYWREPSGAPVAREEITTWLEYDPNVQAARSLGVWSDLNDRVAAFAPYFEAAEHSAQLDGRRLRDLEERFKQGQVNVLSCSTTMEMGVDIGGLSAVVMNNAPPSAANYLQRAGRAGRRGEGVSFAVTLCPNSPHGQQVFSNPLWPFRSTISVPRVALDSERLVQRHVNSLCIALFFATQDAHRLKAGWFFRPGEQPSAPVDEFVAWCNRAGPNDERLVQGLETLVLGTTLKGRPVQQLCSACSDAIETAARAWRLEVKSLEADAAQFLEGEGEPQAPQAPAVLAIDRQLKRLSDEYLLRELVNRQFLPGHGFPTGVVSFIPTTIEDLKKGKALGDDTREVAFAKRSGYPSRQLEMAVREYAPGSEVVIDGRVYESGGVTLNWHLPPNAGEDGVREVQAIRNVWRCRTCGATGDAPSLPDECESCRGKVESHEYLEPAGFAVDIRQRPHNNVTTPTFVPVEAPWISCPTLEWEMLPNPSLGRFRYGDTGHLFHGSRGVGGFGYAVCLRCGRAASEEGAHTTATLPKVFREPHSRLRGGKAKDGSSICDGDGFSIKRGLALGGSRTTDVFELQLAALTDQHVAWSLGIALRQAFTRRLGIEAQEVGVAVRPSKGADRTPHQSIFLFDTAEGGSGYVEAMRWHSTEALRETRHILNCVNNCDAACHGCLLTYGTQYASDALNRHDALAFLSSIEAH